jgi:hypothetical protein
MQSNVVALQPTPQRVFDGNTAVTGAYKVAAGERGTMKGDLSRQWATRPDDQRFTSLADLEDFVGGLADRSFTSVVNTPEIKVQARLDDADALHIALPDGRNLTPTHWSFGQTCTLLGVPAGYLRKLPASIAGINLQYALSTFRAEALKVYGNGETEELRAVTGPDYGRIYDREIVRAVRRIAGNGTGDTRWKVPGMLDWRDGTYNPFVDITKENTTLYASDRDVWMFLVDDTHPIEIGKLPNGDPDLVFRGFYVWNSEVGSKTAGIAAFYLRGICCNRLMWGVERFEQITVRHTKFGPVRFAQEAAPALDSFANRRTDLLLSGVQSAKAAVVARTDEDRESFLTDKAGLTAALAKKVIASVIDEEQKAPESVWDFVQGITAVARANPHADQRVAMEAVAGKLLNKVAA